MGENEDMDGVWEVQVEALSVRKGARWGEVGWAMVGWGLPPYTHYRPLTLTPREYMELPYPQPFQPTLAA